MSDADARSLCGRALIITTLLTCSQLALGAEGQIAPDYGWLSLLPAAVTLATCFATRNVILALFLGIVTGGIVTSQYNIIDAFLIPSLGTEKYAQILLVYLWALGGLIGIWTKNGGAEQFANWVGRRFAKSRRSAKLFAWLMGVLFHQGGTISTVLAGTTVRPVTDREQVSHEELSYIVDSTASPIATIIPFNVWPIYVAGLITIDSLSAIVTDQASAIGWFMKAIPFNFYGWIAVLFTLLFALDKLPFVGRPMRAAITRATETGALNGPNAKPMMRSIAQAEESATNATSTYRPSIIDFLLPIAVLLGFSIVPWLMNGTPMVFEAFGLSLVTAMALSIFRGMSVNDAFEAMVSGISGVTIGAIILGLAVTLGRVSEATGASHFIVDSTTGALSNVPWILPGLLTVICMVVSFSIGSSWGTYAVMFPLALPLAYALSPDPVFFMLNFGAIMGGSVYGDQCSPVSDTTILSSLACGADVMDHVTTQLPIASAAAGLAILTSTAIALTRV